MFYTNSSVQNNEILMAYQQLIFQIIVSIYFQICKIIFLEKRRLS